MAIKKLIEVWDGSQLIGKNITFAFFIASRAAIVKSDGSPGPTPTMVNVGKSVLYRLSKLKNFFISKIEILSKSSPADTSTRILFIIIYTMLSC